MAARVDDLEVLEKGERVILTTDLREVPEGTGGSIILVVGITWFRYWVQFDNGVAVGSVNRKHLSTPAEHAARLAGGDDAAEAATGDAEAADAGGDGDDGGYTHAGVLVPQLLIDRSKAARERLGV